MLDDELTGDLKTLTGGFWLTQWRGILTIDLVCIWVNNRLKSIQNIFINTWLHTKVAELLSVSYIFLQMSVTTLIVCMNCKLQMKCGVSVTVILPTHLIALKSAGVSFSISSQEENLFSHNLLLLLTCFRFPAPYGRKCHSGYSLMGLAGFQFTIMLSSWERASPSSVVAYWKTINKSIAPTVFFESVFPSVFGRNGEWKQPPSGKEPHISQFINLFKLWEADGSGPY